MKAPIFYASYADNSVVKINCDGHGESTWGAWAMRQTEAEAWQWLIAKHNDAYRDVIAKAQLELEKREVAMRGLAQAEKAVTK